MEYSLNVVSDSRVTFDAIATEFSTMMAHEQAVFLGELFDALEHKCGDEIRFRSKLCRIAIEAKKIPHFNMKFSIETLVEFMKPQPTE